MNIVALTGAAPRRCLRIVAGALALGLLLAACGGSDGTSPEAVNDAARQSHIPAPLTNPGARDIAYFRMHGSPRMYYSSYSNERLAALAAQLRASKAKRRWCIFDNTASGAALGNALQLQVSLAR